MNINQKSENFERINEKNINTPKKLIIIEKLDSDEKSTKIDKSSSNKSSSNKSCNNVNNNNLVNFMINLSKVCLNILL